MAPADAAAGGAVTPRPEATAAKGNNALWWAIGAAEVITAIYFPTR